MIRLALVIAICLATSISARATIRATDNASNSAYTGGWADGSNGGTGFSPWTLLRTSGSSSENGHFVGNSTSNGGAPNSGTPDDINTTGSRAWGMYANSAQTASAVRPFSFGTMALNDQFTISIDNGFIDPGRSIGFGLRNSIGQTLFEVFFTGGASTYTVSTPDGGSYTGTSPGYTDEGLVIRYTVTSLGGSSSNFALDFDNLGDGVGVNASGTGKISNVTSTAIAQVRLFNFSTGNGTAGDSFFNSMSVVTIPEPTAALCLPLAGVLAGFARSRRQR